jgi:hypothetical protein
MIVVAHTHTIIERTHLPPISEAAMEETIRRDSLNLLGLAV